jgi:N-carbamoylputrescine amidase
VKFTAAAVQIAPTKADVSANLTRIAEAVRRCVGESADVVVFPETALTGYFLEGGVAEVAVSAMELASMFDVTYRPERPIDVILGFYERAGGIVYNSAAHLFGTSDGWDVVHVHRKFFLPTYGVFDEERFVARGRDVSAYKTRLGHFAMLICEDVWHSVPATIAALKGAQVIAVISASPARGFSGDTYDNLDHYRRMLRAIAEEHGVWVLNSMLVGFEGGKGFCGGSLFVSPSGRIVAEGPQLEEHFLISEIDLDEIEIARSRLPLLADLKSVLEDVVRELEEVNRGECPEK